MKVSSVLGKKKSVPCVFVRISLPVDWLLTLADFMLLCQDKFASWLVTNVGLFVLLCQDKLAVDWLLTSAYFVLLCQDKLASWLVTDVSLFRVTLWGKVCQLTGYWRWPISCYFVRISLPVDWLLTLAYFVLLCQVGRRVVAALQERRGERGATGSWGAWAPWSPCTRSCGGGISVQSRHCDARWLLIRKIIITQT